MDLVGDGFDQPLEEVARRALFGLPMKLDESELARPVDGHEHVEPAFGGPHLGKIDVEEADRVGLELGLGGRLAFDFGQAADAVTLQAAVQRRSGEMRKGRLEGIEAVVERQQGVPPKGDDDRLFLR